MNKLNSLQEIARAVRNLIRTGIVTDVDHDEGLCRVQTGGMQTTWLTAASAGAHAHTVAVGSQTHSVVMGAHTHTITVAAAGNAENTVKNIAYNYIVRLA
ncbi:hypothetical protein QPL63_20400 [Enterobacter hormaechei]|nr:hypothetical protein [Enterobacter hormaechei]MDK3079946.1 hypothetical protein [Enterobacter hormaechei]